MRSHRSHVVCLFHAMVALTSAAALAQPRHVYLTWQSDPATTMTVNFQTVDPLETGSGRVYYDTRSGSGRSYRHSATGSASRLDRLPTPRLVHTIKLQGLKPATTYFFVAGDSSTGYCEERQFVTAPDDDRAIRFVVGGDMGVSERVNKLEVEAAITEPLFCVLGGDLAYVDGDPQRWETWDQWLDSWQQHMVTPLGRTIPMVVAIGNHEVRGGYDGTQQDALFFSRYFAQEQGKSFFTRTFGDNISLIILDSGHLSQHGGDQAEWLRSQLRLLQDQPHLFAAYHVPLFPVYRSYNGFYSRQGREHWQGLFDRYHLSIAFEHHDHALKRTKPIVAGRVDESGTVYVGDGCFGRRPRWVRTPRRVTPARRWYLERLERSAHFWQVDVDERRAMLTAIDEDGEVVDRFERPSRRVDASQSATGAGAALTTLAVQQGQ